MFGESARRRLSQLRPGHWLLIGLAAALLVTVVVAGRNGWSPQSAGSPSATGSASPTPSRSVSPSPMCLPRVVESGYGYEATWIRYGLIVENPCPQAAINNVTTVAAFDSTGRQLNGVGDGDPPDVPVILPGQRIGVGGTIRLPRPTRVARVVVMFVRSKSAAAEGFADWPRVTVDDLTHSEPDSHGLTTFSGRIRSEPPGVYLCEPQIHLILRDRLGRIIYGQDGFPDGNIASFDVELPAHTDFAKTEVYVVLGEAAAGQPPMSSSLCIKG
jgi:hypothetical protein